MIAKNFLLIALLCISASLLEGGRRQPEAPICDSEEDCINNDDCQCYCSVKCGFRDKTEDDRPVYIENDPNGKNCYCKEWDHKNYKIRRCAQKERRNVRRN